ncbi:DUF3509 domain-containing protein [Pseudomonas sp. R5(2019)]|uniref:DUF3509 domain-containing protein n=1 Tax=Pseudomonas sp. R5(2019) TaxID=2697566 RepID=UPI001412CE1E|nr:DUF3509 domain-containing protein [Pseudomonas sp. R5(2019)]NBA95426.1 DUF3509 domain-containing protein [Pseudomonas sp. R5(2019)]
METISVLLNEALTPYQVRLDAWDVEGGCRVTLTDTDGSLVLARGLSRAQLADKRLLIDVVDGLHRDLRVAEGRLQPCVIAALRNAEQGRAFVSSMA